MDQAKDALATTSLSMQAPAINATSKLPAVNPAVDPPTHDLICKGWMLKKGRKKFQGYARRYFLLHANGNLTYSFEPGTSTRDQIYLPSAAISSSPGRKDIHVDSGTVTFHIKCLTSGDFVYWMEGLRKFTPSGSAMEKITLKRSLSVKQSQALQTNRWHQATATLDDMSKIIDELSNRCFPSDADDRRNSTSSTDSGKPRPSDVGRHRDDKPPLLLSMFKKNINHAASPSKQSFSKEGLPSSPSSATVQEQLVPLLMKLRDQHSTLSDLIHGMSPTASRAKSPAPQPISEEAPNGPSWLSSRASMSTVTDSGSIWYDAVSGEEMGAEEYVVTEEPGEDDGTTPSTTEPSETESGLSKVAMDEDEDERTPSEERTVHVERRRRLPKRTAGDEGSLFTVLKKNVGQDLANIAFPVTFNEPLTLLQRAAEEMEYYDLLDKAALTSDWVERICYVAAFAVSGYACTKHRTGRKGFTPLLGETFEDARMNFLAEKVVHKPLVIACHAYGKDWTLDATSSGKTKFWGKSFEIIPTGVTRVCIGEDVYEWNKPSSFTRNLMMGTKYLEHCGEMIVTNTRTNARCALDFKETGYWASAPNVVSGTVFSPDGKTVSRLEGKWDEQMAQKLDSSHLKVLWRASPYPRDASEFYGYTYFGITLNEITPDVKDKLPCTDSRFRPDVRALENADIQIAEHEKARLEQMQRERRLNDKEAKPRWFRPVEGTEEWAYAGGYWEARKQGWKDGDIQPLW